MPLMPRSVLHAPGLARGCRPQAVKHPRGMPSGERLPLWCEVVQNDPIVTNPLPPMSDRIRLTISVTPEVHAVFSRMSEAGGMSLGKCMGEWLADTIDGAQFVAQKMEDARKAPRTVMREMQAFSRGLVAEVDQIAADVRLARGGAGRSPARPGTGAASGAASPPSSNTGGKVPRTNPKKGRT